MTSREKLLNELLDISWRQDRTHLRTLLADFIISDRKRIISPLIKAKEDWTNTSEGIFKKEEILRLGIEEVLSDKL